MSFEPNRILLKFDNRVYLQTPNRDLKEINKRKEEMVSIRFKLPFIPYSIRSLECLRKHYSRGSDESLLKTVESGSTGFGHREVESRNTLTERTSETVYQKLGFDENVQVPKPLE